MRGRRSARAWADAPDLARGDVAVGSRVDPALVFRATFVTRDVEETVCVDDVIG